MYRKRISVVLEFFWWKKTRNTLLVTCMKIKKIKSIHIMLSKAKNCVKGYDDQSNWMYFLLEMMPYWKNIILFRIKSVLISKNQFDSEPVYNKNFLNIKINYGDEVTDFHDKGIPKVDCNHT